MKFALAVLIAFAAAGLSLALRLVLDRRADRAEWVRLAALQPNTPKIFAAEMVADLPEPARRYFGYTIRPGTRLWPVVEIDMRGQFSLGSKEAPNYQPMEAYQILAAPEGFVWAMRTGGGLPLSGSDSGRWTRFRIFGVIPVVRAGGGPDPTRSAFGRMIGEAAIWSPAALLPGPNVVWSAVDEDTARVTVTRGKLVQAVDVRVDREGRPVAVSFQRWSDVNSDKVYRLQPFGGVMADFREVGGYRLPFRVEGGNMFGTDDYFPFFIAEVTAIRFPKSRSCHSPSSPCTSRCRGPVDRGPVDDVEAQHLHRGRDVPAVTRAEHGHRLAPAAPAIGLSFPAKRFFCISAARRCKAAASPPAVQQWTSSTSRPGRAPAARARPTRSVVPAIREAGYRATLEGGRRDRERAHAVRDCGRGRRKTGEAAAAA